MSNEILVNDLKYILTLCEKWEESEMRIALKHPSYPDIRAEGRAEAYRNIGNIIKGMLKTLPEIQKDSYPYVRIIKDYFIRILDSDPTADTEKLLEYNADLCKLIEEVSHNG